jgi:hypothetical protein
LVYSSLTSSDNIAGRVTSLQAEGPRSFRLIHGMEPDASLLWSLLSLIFNWYQGKGGWNLNMTTDLPLVSTKAKNSRNYLTFPYAVMADGGTSWATSLVSFHLTNFIAVTTQNVQQILNNSIINICNQLNRAKVISLFEIMFLYILHLQCL